MKDILVIGSSNTDLIAKVEHFPVAGETIEGKIFLQAMGGKGANQALAAHRLGGKVRFVTCVGNDPNGRNTMEYYSREGLDVTLSQTIKEVPTGTAMILVNGEGENCIVITPGANNHLSAQHIDQLEGEIATAAYVVLQMEIPMATVKRACLLAAKYDTQILLNVAPAKEIDDDLLQIVDILVVNETEIEKVSGQQISGLGEAGVMDTILARGAKTVILTLGRNGCLVKHKGLFQHIPAFKVEAVDTTAAGDTFCGALVAQLNQNNDLIEAIKFATAASALCVTKMGAQPSVPTEAEVHAFLAQKVELVENNYGKSKIL